MGSSAVFEDDWCAQVYTLIGDSQVQANATHCDFLLPLDSVCRVRLP
jgi:hypothetical protein